jgi:hypothetical protein
MGNGFYAPDIVEKVGISPSIADNEKYVFVQHRLFEAFVLR